MALCWVSLGSGGVGASSCAAPGEDDSTWAATETEMSDGNSPAVIVTGALADDLVIAESSAGTNAGNVVEVRSGALSAPAAPAVIYLAYADGKTVQKTQPDPCPTAAPKFVCQFAPTLQACQQQIQAYLDRWYADFNVVFTLTRPTSGSYYTEVISSGGGMWCNAKESVGGVAPFLCTDLKGGVAYTFAGGRTAKETAVIIAQEQAHLVGLEHSASNRDLMYPTICSDCDGFEDIESKVQTDVCGRPKQNSYAMMRERLGPWTGGVKPTPFGCIADSSAPSVGVLEPSDNASVGSTFVVRAHASDDCKVAKVSIRVSPMGLQASTTATPYEWTLTRISGQQTITVTVTDPSNKTTTTSIVVNAPSSGKTGTGGGSGTGTGTGGRGGTGGSTTGVGGLTSAGGTGGPTADATGGTSASPDGGGSGGRRQGDTSLNSQTLGPGGCEVGGCAFVDSRDGSVSTTSLVISSLLMFLLLWHRSPARTTSRAQPSRLRPRRIRTHQRQQR